MILNSLAIKYDCDKSSVHHNYCDTYEKFFNQLSYQKMEQAKQVERIQELMRVLDATLATVNPQGLVDGKNAMSFINFISQVPNMESFVGKDFMSLINNQLESSANKENAREHVKKIWTYPKHAYEPWINAEIDKDISVIALF